MSSPTPTPASAARIYWTAFIGLFFDYYDLYLFVYLEKTLATEFALSARQSSWLQFSGLAAVGLGALVFGYLADRLGRGRMMLAVFGVYVAGLAGLSLAWDYGSLLAFRLVASLALGAEWGISHTYLAERVSGARRYRFSALLQFSILGGLLAAMASRYALPAMGWRWLFAASIVPVALLTVFRWSELRQAGTENQRPETAGFWASMRASGGMFLLCLALASLTIASGYMNVFYARDLPQSPVYTVLFWANVAPGMLFGASVVKYWGVVRALGLYAAGLVALSAGAWLSGSSRAGLAFALVLPLLNGIPFGLMGAWFNEVFPTYRTMLSGAAYNLGRILAGFAPVLIASLGLAAHGRYFLFSGFLGLGVLALAAVIRVRTRGSAH